MVILRLVHLGRLFRHYGGKNLDVERMPAQLLATSVFSRRKVELVEHEVSQLRFRQTRSFLPDADQKGCSVEVDAHFVIS